VALNKLKRGNLIPDDNSKSIEEYAAIAEQAVLKATDITRLISQYTKLDSEFMPEMVELDSLFKDLLSSNQLRLEEVGVRLKIKGEAKFLVKSNRRQLILAFNNLLLNSLEALKDSLNPLITVHTTIENDIVKVIFRDNGGGIPKEDTERIFEPFFTTRAETGGTGIGLAMARRIFEMYGGSIKIIEENIPGTTFEIKLRLFETSENNS
jgi:signal transduction histidine kinase